MNIYIYTSIYSREPYPLDSFPSYVGRSGEAFFETKARSLEERATPPERGVKGSIGWFTEQTKGNFFPGISETPAGKGFSRRHGTHAIFRSNKDSGLLLACSYFCFSPAKTLDSARPMLASVTDPLLLVPAALGSRCKLFYL